MLNTGEKAPDFTLPDQNGNNVSLSQFRGKKVVLYFYPKDSTPGCTKEACSLRDHKAELEAKNAVVIGISRDSIASHKKFENKENLNFILLSDPEHKVIEEYGAWGEKKLYGKTSMGIIRCTYLIDEMGIITDVIGKVSVSTHGEDVLNLID